MTLRDLLCRLIGHRWERRPVFRPGSGLVRFCRRCGRWEEGAG